MVYKKSHSKNETAFFLCGRYSKLYFYGGYFLHREANPYALYEKQTYSQYQRGFDKYFGAIAKVDKLYSEMYSKHFKKHYKGKETKRYREIQRQIDKYNRIELNLINTPTIFGLI